MNMTVPQRVRYMWTGAVLGALRASLEAHGFIEILPALLSERYEPGARHSIAVLGDRALPAVSVTGGDKDDCADHIMVAGAKYYYLPVSHAVEKQLALEHAERVYCVVPCVRLLMEGEDLTRRHLYTFFQAEVEWRTENIDEVYSVVESILARFAREMSNRLIDIDEGARARLNAFAATPYEQITFSEARNRCSGARGAANPHSVEDINDAEEKILSEAAVAPIWLTEYPEGVRDSLYRRTVDGMFATYDLILPGGYGELATGGLRPDSGEDILRQARQLCDIPDTFYADWKKRTRIQTGGLGFGVERLIRYCMGASSVLDLRFAHDQGPNVDIGQLDER
jgi:asparaginyl-tRNA synthetase